MGASGEESNETDVKVHENEEDKEAIPKLSSEQILEELLSIELISLRILGFLPFKDLLTLSLVKKSWNGLARKALNKFKKVTVSLKLSKSSDELLQEFVDSIECSSSILPFNHLQLALKHNIFHCSNYDNCQENLGDQLKNVQNWDKLKIRRLSVTDYDDHHKQCKMLSCLKTVFEKLSPDIESLNADVKYFDLVFRGAKGKFVFPKLTSLNVAYLEPSSSSSSSSSAPGKGSEILELLKSRPPFLKEFMGKVNEKQISFFVTNDLGFLVKNCEFSHTMSEDDLERIFSFIMDPYVKLKRLSILGCDSPEFTRNILEHVLELVIANSEKTLEEFRTSLGIINFISKIRTVCIRLEALTRLVLLFKNTEFREDELLASIPFPNLFPNLRSIYIFDDPSVSDMELIPKTFTKLNSHITTPCPTVSHITFETSSLSLKRTILLGLAKYFPNVRDFTYSKPPPTYGGGIEVLTRSYSLILTEMSVWPRLETLRFKAVGAEMKHLEAFIIGVEEEEILTWRQGHLGYLNFAKFAYAPGKVSIFNRLHLKQLYLGIYEGYPGWNLIRYAERFITTRHPKLRLTTQVEAMP